VFSTLTKNLTIKIDSLCFITLPYSLTLSVVPADAAKTNPLLLHVSLHRIEEERRNVEKRTKLRIAKLLSEEEEIVLHHDTQSDSELLETGRHDKEWHCCLNIFCFCLSLLVLNLLFLQWLYIKVTLKQL
jgi:hypothetical protein